MSINIKLNKVVKFLAVVLVAATISCQPDELGDGNGLTATDLDAGFIISPVAGVNNTYQLSANGSYLTSSWDLGSTSELNFYEGGNTEEVFFPDAGIYTISHKVTGIGGVSEIVSQQLDVETSDPVAGNIVRGGKFQDATDHSEWTVLNISESGATWTFNDGSATVSASGYNQQGMYQAIDVVANKEYNMNMLVSGESNDETWFEVFASTIEPTQNQDYGNNIVMGLNTWDGCGTGSFNGLLSDEGCVNNSYTESINNTVVFDTSGTIYLVIKCGGNQTAGITITNVEMRGTN